MAADRITIMLDKDLVKKLRSRQAELLKKSNKSVGENLVLIFNTPFK